MRDIASDWLITCGRVTKGNDSVGDTGDVRS